MILASPDNKKWIRFTVLIFVTKSKMSYRNQIKSSNKGSLTCFLKRKKKRSTGDPGKVIFSKYALLDCKKSILNKILNLILEYYAIFWMGKGPKKYQDFQNKRKSPSALEISQGNIKSKKQSIEFPKNPMYLPFQYKKPKINVTKCIKW